MPESEVASFADFGGREMAVSTSAYAQPDCLLSPTKENMRLLDWERSVIKEDYRREQERATESPKWLHPVCHICLDTSARMYQHAEGYLCDECWIDTYMPGYTKEG